MKLLPSLKNFFRKKSPEQNSFSLEEVLLSADLGPDVVCDLLSEKNQEKIKNTLLAPFVDLGYGGHSREGGNLLSFHQKPEVVLMVGVNGVGKTTTLAKVAHYFQKRGKKVLIGAGDTFRAAAIDQLKIWGGRLGCEVVAQQPGSDAGAVAFDAVQKGRAKGFDLVLIDTAGRQQTKFNLMEELKKIHRVTVKALEIGKPRVWLVLDGQVGQSGFSQAAKFHESLRVDGVIVAKLDGTAKGGILFSIAKTLKLPILFVGKGEKLEDLEIFQPERFVSSLLSLSFSTPSK